MRDVLDATLRLIARDGVEAVSFAVVAERAGVTRTTLYRRWPTKPALVQAALLHGLERGHRADDTGTIRGDLVEFVRRHVAEGGGPAARRGKAISSGVERGDDPELAALVQLAEDRIRAPVLLAVERAVARGELPTATDPLLVVTPIVATVLHRSARGQDLADAERVVDLVLAGARAGAAVRQEEHHERLSTT